MKKARLLSILLAMVMLLSVLTGCTGDKAGNGAVNLKWYVLQTSANADPTGAFSEAQKLVKEKLGYNLELIPIEAGDYSSKMQMLYSSGETFDISFNSNWLNNYYQNVSKGALMPLDDYLRETPDLYNSIPEYWWDAVRVNGKIYGVPNQQIATRSTCFLIPKKNAELLGLDMTDSNEIMTDYKEILNKIEDYLVKVKEATGTYTKCSGIWSEGINAFGMEEAIGLQLPGAVSLDSEGKPKVINQYETEEFKYYINKRREWVEKGLIQPETEDKRPKNDFLKDGNVYPFLLKAATYKPGLEAEVSGETEMVVFIRTKDYLTNSGTGSTLNCISATSKHPLEALKLLEYVNTEKDFINLITYGVEGVNYNKVGENKVEKIPNKTTGCENWSIGCVYNSYLRAAQDDDTWERTREINDNSEKSPLLGFNPNHDKIKSQITACQSAVDEFFQTLDYGLLDAEDTYKKFITKLNAAGVDEVIKETQRQIDEWYKTK